MSGTREKVGSVLFAVLMVTSVFAGVVALSGSAVAAPPSGGNTDNTQDTTVSQGLQAEVADISFNSSGAVDNVSVHVAGLQSSSVNSDDVSSYKVELYNSTDGKVAQKTVDTGIDATTSTTIDFSSTTPVNNTSVVDRVIVYATPSFDSEEGDQFDANVTIMHNGSSTGVINTNGVQNVTTSKGFISGNVEDTSGDPIENATVTVINQDNGQEVGSLTTDSDGDFVPSRFAVSPNNTYSVRVERFGYTTYSDRVFVGPGETKNILATLEFNLVADNLKIQPTSGTLFANGESSNTFEYTVIVENTSVESASTPINESDFTKSVDLNMTGFGDFIDNGAINTTATVSTTQRGDVDGDGYDESYATIDVTADNADSSTLGVNPIVTEMFNGTTTNSRGTTLTSNNATISYVQEGNESITGEVRNTKGESVEGATVWAVYEGSNRSLDFARNTFVNDDGETFLVGQTNEDGEYVIPGIAGDNTNVTIYVLADGYNRINRTAENGYSDLDRFVAAEEFEQTAGPNATTENHDIVVRSVEIHLDFRVVLDAEAEDGSFQDSVDMPIRETRDLQAQVQVKTEKQDTSEFTDIQNSSLVDDVNVNFTIENGPGGANLGTSTVSTNSSPAMNSITAGTRTSPPDVLVNATVTDDDGDVAWDTANVTIFGIGTISGDVVDNQTQPVATTSQEYVRVNLWVWNGTANAYEAAGTAGVADRNYVNTSRFGQDQAGHYAFTSVRTGEDYKLNVTIVDRDTNAVTRAPGFATVDNKTAGTSTADIVLSADRADLLANTIQFDDQNSTGASVTVQSVTHSEPSFVVITNSTGTVLGTSDRLPAGDQTDLTIDLTTTISESQELRATLYHDDGDGTFESDEDTPVRTDSAQINVTSGMLGDTNGDGEVSTTELNDAISTWVSGGYTTTELNQIIQNWVASA